MKLDAKQSVFFARELEAIDKRIAEEHKPYLEGLSLVNPSASLAMPHDRVYSFKSYSARGVAQFSSDYASGSPRAEVGAEEDFVKLKSIRVSYGYSIQEIREGQAVGRPLDMMKKLAAMRAVEELINKVAILGDAAEGLAGIASQPNVSILAATGAWSGLTAAQIEADMFRLVESIPNSTFETEAPNRLLLPHNMFRLVKRLQRSTASDLSVLEYFQQQNPQIEVRGCQYLETAGVSGVARAIAYNSDPMMIEMPLPIAFEEFEEEQNAMSFKRECHARIGPVVLRYPKSMAYLDGI